MKKPNITLLFLISLIISACGSSISTETRTTNPAQGRPTPTTETQSGDPVEIPVPYPGLPPTAIPLPEGYPAPEEYPTIDPYPVNVGTVWVLYPLGLQCEDTSASKYKSEQDAKAGLTAAGINVFDVTTTELMVCAACGCPTSTHYRAEISETHLNKAVSLGWEPE
ncbi:MAG: hypothetical protein IAF02_08415 [Anaerolineae bacterium]|nr:hypothetical protein [Anaerolineae bacterium]